MFQIIFKNKHKIIYSNEYFKIIVGRSRLANDMIIDEYIKKPYTCYWYHVQNDTSAHVILEPNSISPPLTMFIYASSFIKNNIYKPVTKTNEKSIIMICKLNDITKTDISGRVLVTNPYMMDSSNWYDIYKI